MLVETCCQKKAESDRDLGPRGGDRQVNERSGAVTKLELYPAMAY